MMPLVTGTVDSHNSPMKAANRYTDSGDLRVKSAGQIVTYLARGRPGGTEHRPQCQRHGRAEGHYGVGQGRGHGITPGTGRKRDELELEADNLAHP